MIKGTHFKRPSPPTSTLPSGMDNLIKHYFDQYRAKKALPPELIGTMEGELVDIATIKKWRFWKTGPEFIDTDGNRLFGALDDCLISDGIHIPLDYKTRGFDLKENSTSYYILQMSCYNFLISKNKRKTSNYAYLIFYIPKEVREREVDFKIEVKKVETLPLDKVYEIFRSALDTLALPNPPQKAKECSFCNWASHVAKMAGGDTQLKLF